MQSIEPESRAWDVISSFPPSDKNYTEAINNLKERFGLDDILVEVYVRDMLSLILQNVTKGKEEFSLSSLYDKLSSQMRALETLEVTTDTCVAMLLPLVESCLPSDLLRVWKRSGSTEKKESNNKSKDMLDALMNFLKREVQNEERINIAMIMVFFKYKN